MATLFETREQMVELLVRPDSAIAEIGVFKGTFSKFLYEHLQPSKLVLFDLFEGQMCSGNQDGNFVEYTDLAKDFVQIQEWAKSKPEIVFEKGDSSTLLSRYPDQFFEMIYIDGDHSYGGVKRDLEQAVKKVKPGGWIMGHDYEMNMNKAKTVYNFGVKRAVDEFCETYKQTVLAKGNDGCVSYAIQMTK